MNVNACANALFAFVSKFALITLMRFFTKDLSTFGLHILNVQPVETRHPRVKFIIFKQFPISQFLCIKNYKFFNALSIFLFASFLAVSSRLSNFFFPFPTAKTSFISRFLVYILIGTNVKP